EQTLALLDEPFHGLLFVNLVEFDSLYGHRRDPAGYAAALEEFDSDVPRLLSKLGDDDLLVITADHGNDPVHPGTDHTREYVPVLAYSPRMRQAADIGVRASFADLAATIADNFGVPYAGHGKSFLASIHE